MLDYLIVTALLTGPWLLGLDDHGAAAWAPVAVGVVAVVARMLAEELSLTKKLALSMHLSIDATAGVLLVASPWLVGYYDFVWIPHVAVGAIELAAPGVGPRLLLQAVRGVAV